MANSERKLLMENNVAVRHGQQLSFTEINSKRKGMKGDFYKLNPLQTIIKQDSSQITTTIGTQYNKFLNQSLFTSEITGLLYSSQKRLYVHSYVVESTMVNQSNCQLVIDLYDCQCHKATNDGPLDSYNTGVQGATGGIGAIGYSSIIGIRPRDIPRFYDFWKIVKHHRVVLNPGEVWIHTQEHRVKKVFKGQDMFPNFQNSYLPGHSVGAVMFVKGIPINALAGTIVTTSGNQILDIVNIYRIKLVVFNTSAEPEGITATQSLATTLATAQDKMGVDTDTAANMANA